MTSEPATKIPSCYWWSRWRWWLLKDDGNIDGEDDEMDKYYYGKIGGLSRPGSSIDINCNFWVMLYEFNIFNHSIYYMSPILYSFVLMWSLLCKFEISRQKKLPKVVKHIIMNFPCRVKRGTHKVYFENSQLQRKGRKDRWKR